MSKLSSKPPETTDTEVEEFISGAEKKEEGARQAKATKEETYPWDSPSVRGDMIKVFNLRLSEPYFLKLKYISDYTPDSKQKFCQDALRKAIDKKIREMTK